MIVRGVAPGMQADAYPHAVSGLAINLFFASDAAYIDVADDESAIAINGLRNKPFGPGGSTRRLHHSGVSDQTSVTSDDTADS